MRGFVETQRAGYVIQRFQLTGAGTAFVRKKSGKMKGLRGQTTGGQGGGEGTWAGYAFHTMSGLQHSPYDAFAWIANAGRAGIANQGNSFALG